MSDIRRRIDTDADVSEGLAALLAADPRLIPVSEVAGPLPLRRRPPGFEGLAAIITSQQISRFAAADTALRSAGLSGAKIRTLTGIATAISEGFDLGGVEDLPPDEARAALVALKGIGPWTAEIYLLFCV